MLTLVLNVIHFLAEVQRQQGEPGLHLVNLSTLHSHFLVDHHLELCSQEPDHWVVSLCLVLQL